MLRVAVALLSVLLLSVGPSAAVSGPAEVGRATLDGREVVFFDNGFWRYATPDSVPCHEVPHIGTFCSPATEWSVFPEQPIHAQPVVYPEFAADGRLWGQFQAYKSPVETNPFDAAQIEQMVLRRVTGPTGLQPLQMLREEREVKGRVWTTRVFTGRFVRALSAMQIAENHWVIAETRQGGTTLFHRDHAEMHDRFLRNLEVSDVD